MASNFLSPVIGQRSRGDLYPSPWQDMASLSMPDTYANALEWAEYCFFANSTYARAQQRIVSYFLTDIDVKSADADKSIGDDERNKWLTLCNDTVGILAHIAQLNIDEKCYGNSFVSLLVPFKRMLISSASGLILSFREMVEQKGMFNLKYDADKNVFEAFDQKTEKRCEWRVYDIPKEEVELKVWNPKEIQIVFDPWSHERRYIWKIPADYKREIKRGNMHLLERAPLEVLKAVKEEGLFMFAPDALYHAHEPTLSGLQMRGWGLSQALLNFKDIWYVQVVRRYNEAIALDYVIPFRVITPDMQVGSEGTGESLRMNNMGNFGAQVRNMLRKRRRDPASWHTMPFPIRYQALGGDAKQLAPQELLEQGNDIMLNAAGAPAEFYRGTLQFNVAPVALRLFEASHHNLVHGNNRLLRWFVDRVTQLLPLPAVRLAMRRVTYADDFSKNMAALQMFMGQQLSGTTALGNLGYEWREETRQIAEEEKFRQKTKADLMEEMEQAAFGEQVAKGQIGAQPGAQPGAPPAGAPAGGVDPATGQPMQSPVESIMGGGGDVTPEDMVGQADAIADKLLGMDPGQRSSEMRSLKQKNQVIHSLVKAKIDEKRQQARLAGGAMLMGAGQPQAGAA